jgi:hypothetical protein
MSSDDDDESLCDSFLHNKFEVSQIARSTPLFECTAQQETHVGLCGTFASTPVHALHAFLAERPQHAGGVRLRVCALREAALVFDLDPLQYTRAYAVDLLSLYVGAVGKAQRRKVLGNIYEQLNAVAAQTRPELDAFADLTRTTACGFDWTPDACVDEISELHPLVAGIHFCAPGASLFDPRLLRLLHRRARLHEHGTINIDAASVELLRAAPLQYPPPRLWQLAEPDARAMDIHSIGLSEPAGFTSLNETGWRILTDLRQNLLEYVHGHCRQRHTTEQAAAYTTLLRQCTALAPLPDSQ